MCAPNLQTYIAEKLEEDGYDGLCSEGCGCGLDDFMPCGESNRECVVARAVTCTWDEDKAEGPEISCGECEGHMPGGTCYQPAKLPAP